MAVDASLAGRHLVPSHGLVTWTRTKPNRGTDHPACVAALGRHLHMMSNGVADSLAGRQRRRGRDCRVTTFTEPSSDLRQSSTRPVDAVTMTSSPATRTATPITVVATLGCHFCLDAQDALEEIGHDFPIQVTTVDLRSGEGLRLAQQFRASMSPLVLVDGRFLSAGRLPRGKLRALLSARPAQPGNAS